MKTCVKCKKEKSNTSFYRLVRGKYRHFIGCNDCAKKQSLAAKAGQERRDSIKLRFEDEELQGVWLLSRQLLKQSIINVEY